MYDSINYIINGFEYEIEFTATKGQVSNDYFQPDEPDEFTIDDILFNDNPVSLSLFNLFVAENEFDIIKKIEEHCYGY